MSLPALLAFACATCQEYFLDGTMDAQGNYWAELSAPGHFYPAVVVKQGELRMRFIDPLVSQPRPLFGSDADWIRVPRRLEHQILAAGMPVLLRGSLSGMTLSRLLPGTYRFRFEFDGLTARYGRGRKDFDRVGRVWSRPMRLIKDSKGVRVEPIRRD